METLILTGLAIYGISWALVYSDGAWGIMSKIRSVSLVEGFGILNCLACTSFWVSLPVAFMIDPIAWLGIWGAVIIVDNLINNVLVR